MTPEMLARFEALLAAGRDDPMLRLTLGQGCLANGRAEEAVDHLREAIAQRPDYTAAWKQLGRALEASGEPAGAAEAYATGIEVAERTGDRQLGKEMAVYLKRLSRR